MFTNLIESTSHQREMTRKGRFFLATLAAYALVFAGAGVASIYAYDAQLDNQNLDFIALVAPVDAPVETQAVRPNVPRNSAASPERENAVAMRTEAIAQIANSTKAPDSISATASKVPELPSGPVILGNKNSEGSGPYNPNLPIGPGGPPSGPGGGGPMVDVSTMGTPPVSDPPKAKPILSKGVITGLALSKPNPPYPPLALRARAQGVVSVQILVDESGKVISARAVSGHPLLRQASEQAAMRTRFSPTKLSGVPVKVTGTITFNFTLDQ
jgi:protein TonB